MTKLSTTSGIGRLSVSGAGNASGGDLLLLVALEAPLIGAVGRAVDEVGERHERDRVEDADREPLRQPAALQDEQEDEQHAAAHQPAALERTLPRRRRHLARRAGAARASLAPRGLLWFRPLRLLRPELGDGDLVALLVDLEHAHVVAEILLAPAALLAGGHGRRLAPQRDAAFDHDRRDDVAGE